MTRILWNVIKKTGFLGPILLLICSFLPWPTPPDTISAQGENVSSQKAAIEENGNIVVVWVGNGAVKSNSANVGGNWGQTPEIVSGWGVASSPEVVMDSFGKATCVWVQDGSIYTSEKPLGGSWLFNPIVLSGQGASSPRICMDAMGNLVVVWLENGLVKSATKLYNGSWSGTPDTLSGPGASSPQVAIGASGTVVAVWQGVVSATPTIFSATKLVNGNWNEEAAVSTNGINSAFPSVAVSPNGDAAAVWFSYDVSNSVYSNVVVQGSYLLLNGSWSSPTSLSNPGYRNPVDLKCQANCSPAGQIIAIWSTSQDGALFQLQYSIYSNGNWGALYTFQGPNICSNDFDSRIDAIGDTFVAWSYLDTTENSLKIIGTVNDISGINQQIANFWELSTTGMSAYPDAAIAASEDRIYGVCSWINFDGMNNLVQTIQTLIPIIQPPVNLSVTQQQNAFGVLTEYTNVLTWEASPSQNVANYIVFRDGLFLTSIYELPFEYRDPNRVPGQSVTYEVAAYDSNGLQSAKASVIYPP